MSRIRRLIMIIRILTSIREQHSRTRSGGLRRASIEPTAPLRRAAMSTNNVQFCAREHFAERFDLLERVELGHIVVVVGAGAGSSRTLGCGLSCDEFAQTFGSGAFFQEGGDVDLGSEEVSDVALAKKRGEGG